MTDRRTVACLGISSGCLKWEGTLGRYFKVTEDNRITMAGRTFGKNETPIDLFNSDGNFVGISESGSQPQPGISVAHFITNDDFKRVLYLMTRLEEEIPLAGRVEKTAIRTQWQRSMDAIVFATHVGEDASRTEQLRQLAKLWKANSQYMQWCPVGRQPKSAVRYITTRLDPQLRFFEAGNVSENRRVIIRQTRKQQWHVGPHPLPFLEMPCPGKC
jgi:hypothetical protein